MLGIDALAVRRVAYSVALHIGQPTSPSVSYVAGAGRDDLRSCRHQETLTPSCLGSRPAQPKGR